MSSASSQELGNTVYTTVRLVAKEYLGISAFGQFDF